MLKQIVVKVNFILNKTATLPTVKQPQNSHELITSSEITEKRYQTNV